MALNPDKSHAILLGTAQRAQSFSGLQSIDVAGSATSLVSHIKLLGVTLDSHLTISEHTKLVSQSSFCHIRPLRHMRGVLDQSTAAAIAWALISSRLDYANSVLFGSSAKISQKYPERSSKNCSTKVILSVFGRHTSRTPLVANSVVHQI